MDPELERLLVRATQEEVRFDGPPIDVGSLGDGLPVTIDRTLPVASFEIEYLGRIWRFRLEGVRLLTPVERQFEQGRTYREQQADAALADEFFRMSTAEEMESEAPPTERPGALEEEG